MDSHNGVVRSYAYPPLVLAIYWHELLREGNQFVTPNYFANASAFRNWLEANCNQEVQLLVGFHKKSSGRGGLTYPEALDEALCFGWIDGVRRNAGRDAYTIRFTPRRERSVWSLVNI